MDRKLKKVLNLRPHFNIADSVPLGSIAGDGTAETADGLWSRTYRVQDINFGTARREERGAVSRKWAGVLQSIDPSYDLQVCIYNHSVSLDYLTEDVLLQEAGDGPAFALPIWSGAGPAPGRHQPDHKAEHAGGKQRDPEGYLSDPDGSGTGHGFCSPGICRGGA